MAAGKHAEVEVGHAFPAAGPAGDYTATLVVLSGTVHLSEGGVDLDEPEDAGAEDD